MNVHSSPVCNSSKLEISQMSSTVEWMTAVYKYSIYIAIKYIYIYIYI